MEFNNSVLNQQQAPTGRPVRSGEKRPRRRSKWLNTISVLLLISIAFLVGAIILVTSTSKAKSESDLVDKSKYQAVFLEGGQVYFGKVRSMNNDFVELNDIYYLKVGNQAQEETPTTSQDVSLSKLGCELHRPQDQMVINRSQITFWENLQDEGQVVKAINAFVKENPNGQKCNEASTQQPTSQPQGTNEQQTPSTP